MQLKLWRFSNEWGLQLGENLSGSVLGATADLAGWREWGIREKHQGNWAQKMGCAGLAGH